MEDNKRLRLYRFRSAEALVGDYQELEKGYFYFASKEELNDPMEGFVNLYWQGDIVLWKNLLKHYIYCLSLSFEEYLFSGKNDYCKKENIPVFINETKLRKIPFGTFLSEIVDSFMAEQEVIDLLDFITSFNRKVSKDELLWYFSALQHIAFYYVNKAFSERYETFSINEPKDNSIFKKLKEQYNKVLEDKNLAGKEDLIKVLAPFLRQEHELMRISFKQEFQSKLEADDFAVKSFFLFDFPAYYVDRLREISFPNFYYTCFMTSFDNVAHWGYYANSNKGCCLIFEPEMKDGKPCMDLNRRDKNGGISFVGSELIKVVYKLERQELNFFENIGNLRLVPEELESSWYKDKEGKLSKTYAIPKKYEELKAWKITYNQKMEQIAITKFPAWQAEQEYRLFLHDGFECTSDKESRKFCYDFSCLKGIAFGVNTSEEDKLKIIDVMTQKCKKANRTDFKFYQAEINIVTGKVELKDLMIMIDAEERK